MADQQRIKAISTRYAGCHFRSRTEARWSVFFEHIGIRWEYEPQGFTVNIGGRWGEPTPYLPDFWLPTLGLWAEVKGVMTDRDLDLLIGATYDGDGLPRDPSGRPLDDAMELRGEGNPVGNRNGPRILILGTMPAPDAGDLHHALSHHKGDINVCHFEWIRGGVLFDSSHEPFTIANDAGDRHASRCDLLGTCFSYPGARTDGSAHRARQAARSARFEHGETPAEDLAAQRLAADRAVMPWFGDTLHACVCMPWQQCDRCAG